MKSRDAKCIATHKRPDVDALVSVWLAECYLFSDHPVKIEFLDYGVDVEQLTGVDCVVGGSPTIDLRFLPWLPLFVRNVTEGMRRVTLDG